VWPQQSWRHPTALDRVGRTRRGICVVDTLAGPAGPATITDEEDRHTIALIEGGAHADGVYVKPGLSGP